MTTSVKALGDSVLKIFSDYEQRRRPVQDDAGQIIVNMRNEEKRKLATLNDLLAIYMEKLSHLQLQNNNLTDLKLSWETDLAAIRTKYRSDIDNTKTILSESDQIKLSLDAQVIRHTKDVADYQQKIQEAIRKRDENKHRIDNLLIKLCNTEKELAVASQHVKHLENEIARMEGENQILRDQLELAKNNVSKQRLNMLNYRGRVEEIKEANEKIRREQEEKWKKFVQNVATVGPNVDCSEISRAIAEIRGKFEEWALQNEIEVETLRTITVEEGATEIAALRIKIKQLRLDLEVLLAKIKEVEIANFQLRNDIATAKYNWEKEQSEYEKIFSDLKPRIQYYTEENLSLHDKIRELMNINRSLHTELETYKRLIDSGNVRVNDLSQETSRGETRVSHKWSQETTTSSTWSQRSGSQESGFGTFSENASVGPNILDSPQRTLSRQSTGKNVQFVETILDDKLIAIENTSNQDQNIGGWKIKREINDKEIVYHIPDNFLLKANNTVKIYVRGQGMKENMLDILVFQEIETWGNGTNVSTILFDRNGEV